MKKILLILAQLLIFINLSYATQFISAGGSVSTTTLSGFFVAKTGDTMTGPLNTPELITSTMTAIDVNGLFIVDSSGTLSMFMENGGNVGIGTINPVATLEVAGSIQSSSPGLDGSVTVTDSSDVAKALINSSGNSFLIGGNVGIGTTTPSVALHVIGSIRSSGDSDGTLTISDSSSVIKVFLDTAGDSFLNGGNVGIGISTPSVSLEVIGNILSNTTMQAPIGDFDTIFVSSIVGTSPVFFQDSINLGLNDLTNATTIQASHGTFDTVAASTYTGGTGLIFFQAEYDKDLGDYRVFTLGGGASFQFNIAAPFDFVSINTMDLIVIPSAGAAGSGKDIDLFSSYALLGEAFNANTESDTTTVYDLSGTTNQFFAFDVSGVFTSLAAGHVCGLTVTTNSIGGDLNVIGIRMLYNK